MKKLAILLLFPLLSFAGKIINPITDINWNCLFPIHISGLNVTPKNKDHVDYKKGSLCFCRGKLIQGEVPKAGLPLAFWEPLHVVEVTRVPYKLITLGGARLSSSGDLKKHGFTAKRRGARSANSFYHVHVYESPFIAIFGMLLDFPCIEKSSLEIAYMSELDPFWGDDAWTLLLHPEAILFANMPAQAACLADCASANLHKPSDRLFWCAGCLGSLYPFSGVVGDHVSPIQASSLLVHRFFAKAHRLGWAKAYRDEEFCGPSFLPIIKKSAYKMQLIYPISQTKGKCKALGQSDLFWGSGKSFPVKGEDFAYVVWKKKHCCLDAVKPATEVLKGGLK